MVKSNVTNNVLESISKKLISNSLSSDSARALVLINGSNIDISEQIKFIQNLKKNYDVSLGFSFMAERLVDTKRIIELIKPIRIYKEEDIFNLKSIIEEHSILVAPNITVNTLSKVSLGMIDGFVPNLIWSCLYFGKEVYIGFESVRNYMGVQSKSKEISNMIEDHIDNVIKMGALEIGTIEIRNTRKSIDLYESKDKQLITERDIVNLDKGQKVLILNKGTLITPLAKDKAKELGINIEIR
ncbi:hypothetical protein [Tissierella sp. Yu-01]|uniref:hypothetical protein n=1 Tax=Tissierella sp. Yu-01 TaxID=3035694 RepID=UPI00240D9752|nr:hypothetical protein [Tissierella sp. Yu-01]WFA07838.1 hypothetical protein P3962_08840 [Tissierella sp. Yu-01]